MNVEEAEAERVVYEELVEFLRDKKKEVSRRLGIFLAPSHFFRFDWLQLKESLLSVLLLKNINYYALLM